MIITLGRRLFISMAYVQYRQKEVFMKRWMMFSVFFLFAFAVMALNPVWGQEKNLAVNKEVTAKIRALDREFFKGFDVYSAGVKEAPSALLFDIKKDDYHLPVQFWENPLSEEEIVYAIHRLDDQYIERTWDIPFEPRALNIVNAKGEILGYVYTGLTHVLMDRKKDGRVTVFLPTARQYEGTETHDPGASAPK
jgi:hypothetical protein